ncbi:MAG: energy-coupling factor transporter ATPase [Lachnospiraceae bacterium]|nr:energy-coupling factor transporter ATPase [Lachnospiraceae bacterium]
MLLELKDVGYTYGLGTAYEVTALQDINLQIGEGEFIGVIGHTGSGKSTLIQHLNGLIRPTSGKVLYRGQDIWGEKYDLRSLRTHVGLVFQYPENQLFETDVLTDVMFGPGNQGLTKEAAKERAIEALAQVGVGEALYGVSPFELSGGQKRRVAIAGVLAMNPEVLILDEPTAGLDPAGRDEILSEIRRLQTERGITVILVSHSMEDVAEYAGRLLVIHDGRLVYDAPPREVFTHYLTLEKMGLAAPQVTYLMHALKERGLPVDITASTVAEAKDSILRALKTGTRERDLNNE